MPDSERSEARPVSITYDFEGTLLFNICPLYPESFARMAIVLLHTLTINFFLPLLKLMT